MDIIKRTSEVTTQNSRCLHLYESLVSDVYSMKTDKAFLNDLKYNIRFRGEMDMLISDGARSDISNRIKEL
jgi:hypothetical protein